jgi:hypothetical protein
MKANSVFEIVVLVSGDPSEDGHESTIESERLRLAGLLDAESSIGKFSSVDKVNLGRGADWIVLMISFAFAAIEIPEAHKRVREGIEEWMRIWSELNAIAERLSVNRTVFFPDVLLYGTAIERMRARSAEGTFVFRGILRLPKPNPDLEGKEDLLFSFETEGWLHQVAVSRSGRVLWENEVQLLPEATNGA